VADIESQDEETLVTSPAVRPIRGAEFNAASKREEARLCIALQGHADVGAKTALDGFVAEVDREASSGSVTEVVVDMRSLDFMNSSCLKTLVTWLNNVRQRPESKQYPIRFLRDHNAYWQERSLDALRAFAPGIVKVE
jgi:anti-anti-sigma factor